MTLSRKELIERLVEGFEDLLSSLGWHEIAAKKALLRDLANNSLSVLDQAGMVIVPREPSEAMLDAGDKARDPLSPVHLNSGRTWSAMIEAALTDQQI